MNENKKPKKLKLEQLNRVSVSEFKQVEKIPLVVVLDNIRSMHNVGSVFRTSDAFKVEKIVLCGITPRPPHREITKSALGATESVEWVYEEEISQVLQSLQKEGYQLIGIEQMEYSVSLKDFKMLKNQKYVIVFGNEVEGLSEDALEMYDKFIEIPQEGTKHSLNVSVTAGIVIWDFYKGMG